MNVRCDYCGATINRKPTKTNRHYCNNNCKGLWQKKQRELLGFTKGWLYEEYITNGKSANQIAREIKRDPKRVWDWLRDYGIKTRPRGTDYGQCFKIGDVSAFKGKKHTPENKEKTRQKRLADGHVPYLKNGKHWLHETGRRPASWKGGITPERQAFYSTKEWACAVKEVWRRDNAICQRCKINHNDGNRGTFHIHHIESFIKKEKRSHANNLVLLCNKCHRWVHSKKNKNKLFIKE